MHKKNTLTPEEVTELFSEIDASGKLDPSLAKRRSDRQRRLDEAREAGDSERVEELELEARSAHVKDVDPLSDDDPSGSDVGHTITRTAIFVVVAMIVLVVGMQIGYGVMRRLNTANLSENVTYDSVKNAIEGGVEWGNGFTQFPQSFTVNEADERTGNVEVTVVDTESSNELELLSNGQIQAAALATNALLNDKIDRVVYNVHAYVGKDGTIQHSSFFGMVPATGTQRAILSFVWTKPAHGDTNNLDWQLRIVSMDDEITSRIQKQVNSVSSLIDDPQVTQNKLEEEKAEDAAEHQLETTGEAPEATNEN